MAESVRLFRHVPAVNLAATTSCALPGNTALHGLTADGTEAVSVWACLGIGVEG